MGKLTKLFEWVEDRLDRGAWFRRFYVIAATVLTWQVVIWSFRYAETAMGAKAEMVGVAAVIGAVSAAAGAVQAFAFKQYLDSR